MLKSFRMGSKTFSFSINHPPLWNSNPKILGNEWENVKLFNEAIVRTGF